MRAIYCGLLLLLLAGSGWAQPAAQEAAGRLIELCQQAQQQAKSVGWPAACAVRLEILQRQASLIQSQAPGADVDRYLRFFSVSRQVFGLTPPPSPLSTTLGEIEQASVSLARGAGKSLDLPPLSAGASVAPLPAPTLAQLKQTVQRADSLAQSIWADVRNQALPADPLAARARQDLVGLAESLKNLSAALNEGGNASSRWQAFYTNRIRFLASYTRLPPLDQRLTQLVQAAQDIADGGRRLQEP